MCTLSVLATACRVHAFSLPPHPSPLTLALTAGFAPKPSFGSPAPRQSRPSLGAANAAGIAAGASAGAGSSAAGTSSGGGGSGSSSGPATRAGPRTSVHGGSKLSKPSTATVPSQRSVRRLGDGSRVLVRVRPIASSPPSLFASAAGALKAPPQRLVLVSTAQFPLCVSLL